MPSSKACSGFLAFLLLSLLMVPCVAAQDGEAVKIAVLPFEVNAQEDLNYLKDSLPELLGDRLRDAGFELVDSAAVDQAMAAQGVTSLDIENARQVAVASGASYALYGTFSQLGEALSLEARFVEAFGLEPALPVFSNKEGLINLLPLVDEVVAQVRASAMSQDTIASIDVEGTRVLDKDVVLIRLGINKGDDYSPKAINNEIKTIYDLGYFDDVAADVTDVTGGKRVVFKVTEKPRIQSLGVRGSEVLDEDDIVEIVSSKTGAVLNPKVLRTDMATIRAYYKNKGYYKTKVSYEIEGGENGQAKLNFIIEEGKKLYIKEIVFDGAEQIDPDDLKDELALSEEWMFTWLDDSGVLNEELLDRDGASVQAYYSNRGFLNVKVARPEVDFRDDGIYVTFRVSEGTRFKVNAIVFKGDLIADDDEFQELIELDTLLEDDEYINSEIVRSDIESLTTYYNDKGYAYADIGAKYKPDEDAGTVEVVYVISKHQKVRIRRVFLEGNTITRDNIILRSLHVGDGDLYSGSAIETSVSSLEGLNYFSGVDIEPIPTGDPAEMDLKVAVEEKSTGTLGGGVGYSSTEGVYLAGDITERNLMGLGNTLSLGAKFGGSTTSWDFSFFNPRLFDSYWGGGFTTSMSEREYNTYDKDSVEAGFNIARYLGKVTMFRATYNIDNYTINNIDDDAADSIQDAEGSHLESAATFELVRSTLSKSDFYFSEGTSNSIGLTFAGSVLGGTDDYVKWIYNSSFYTPVVGDLVFHFKGNVGFLHENFGGEDIPVSERFELGGISTVRGYSADKISPRDSDGDRIGGNKFLVTNLELTYPLDKDFGVLGLLFFDAGNAWKEGEFFFDEQDPADDTYTEAPTAGMFKSVGGGIRWMSPMGPLRIEYGFGLDKLDDSGSHKFEFMMGQAF